MPGASATGGGDGVCYLISVLDRGLPLGKASRSRWAASGMVVSGIRGCGWANGRRGWGGGGPVLKFECIDPPHFFLGNPNNNNINSLLPFFHPTLLLFLSCLFNPPQ